MGERKRLICDAALLQEGGKGVRFSIERDGSSVPAFAVRYDGRVYAYVNRCAHISVQLDWIEGEFFDFSGLYLVCSTHGASYRPDSGRCLAGPCAGRGLERVAVEESEGSVYLILEQ